MRVFGMAACCVLTMGTMVSGTAVAAAQMGAPAAQGPAIGSISAPSAALDAQLSLIEMQMMGAVKAMPAEKYGFAPSAGIFAAAQKTEFATVRTFGQQVAHVAEANYFFFNMVSGLKPDVDVQGIEKLTSKDDVVNALAGSFAFGHKAIATLTAANAFEVIKWPEPGLATRATVASFAVAHAFDHYGQMVEYLRMNGMVPPASAK
ncbi:MAG TPA: DinB family protein [Terracidiphilus sp.]|nr:DinB family protein [Terracidiphilus sp.]